LARAAERGLDLMLVINSSDGEAIIQAALASSRTSGTISFSVADWRAHVAFAAPGWSLTVEGPVGKWQLASFLGFFPSAALVAADVPHRDASEVRRELARVMQ
jgi:hypothetical protein